MLCALAPPYLGSSHRGNRDPRASGRDRRSAADRTSRSVREVVERGGVRGQELVVLFEAQLAAAFPAARSLCPSALSDAVLHQRGQAVSKSVQQQRPGSREEAKASRRPRRTKAAGPSVPGRSRGRMPSKSAESGAFKAERSCRFRLQLC